MVNATCPECNEPLLEGWLTIAEAAQLSEYSRAYVRRLANQGRVEARKLANAWLIERESLEAYKARIEALGPEKHDPWRDDLTSQGRGRQAGR